MRADSPSLHEIPELHAVWRHVEMLERLGAIDAAVARRLRDGVFERAVALGLDVELRRWLDFDDV